MFLCLFLHCSFCSGPAGLSPRVSDAPRRMTSWVWCHGSVSQLDNGQMQVANCDWSMPPRGGSLISKKKRIWGPAMHVWQHAIPGFGGRRASQETQHIWIHVKPQRNIKNNGQACTTIRKSVKIRNTISLFVSTYLFCIGNYEHRHERV